MPTQTYLHGYKPWYGVLLISSLLFVACKKEGPAGPPGNANVKSGTVSLTNTDWKWNSFWTLTTNTGSNTSYPTRYVDINTDLVTQDIADKGSVQVFFKPDGDVWAPLPYTFLDVTRNYFFNFMYEHKAGRIRLHYFWTSNIAGGGAPANLNTYVLPNYTFKYVITAAAN